jgi:glycine/D-amino acid oxidase-like deaminating enzyme
MPLSVEGSYLTPKFDAIIIGGGYTGLNTAIHLNSEKPEWKIAIVEKFSEGSAASTRSAGFACFGSPGEILDDLLSRPRTEVLDLVKQRFSGIKKLANLETIDAHFNGGYEVFVPEEENTMKKILNALPELNSILSEATGMKHVFKATSIKSMNTGFQDIAVWNGLEFQLNPGLLHEHLVSICEENGVTMYSGMEVQGWEKVSEDYEIHTSSNKLNTARVILCTNGLTESLLPNAGVTPSRAQVLITSPLSSKPPIGGFHAFKGYYYFRNMGDRVMLGGGRQTDIEGETTTNAEVTDEIQNHLENYLKTYVLPNQPWQIESRWAGIMGFGDGKKPVVKAVEDGVFAAYAFGGMGVALSDGVAKELADLVLDS